MIRKKEFISEILDSFYILFPSNNSKCIDNLKINSESNTISKNPIDTKNVSLKKIENLLNTKDISIEYSNRDLISNIFEPNWNSKVLFSYQNKNDDDDDDLKYYSLTRSGLYIKNQIKTPVIKLDSLLKIYWSKNSNHPYTVPIYKINFNHRIFSNFENEKFSETLCEKLNISKKMIESRQSFQELKIEKT